MAPAAAVAPADAAGGDAQILYGAAVARAVAAARAAADGVDEGCVGSVIGVQTLDEVFLSVEGAGVGFVAGADGHPGHGSAAGGVAAGGIEGDAGVEVDVGVEAGVLGKECAVVIGVVEAVGKELQVGGGVELVIEIVIRVCLQF